MTDLIKTKGETAAFGLDNRTHSVLGEVAPRLQTAGRIHPGIMRLTKAALADNTEITVGKSGQKSTRAQYAKHLYEVALQKGAGFQETEGVIKKRCGFGRSPMTPQNVPYYSVRRKEFTNPVVADTIWDSFAEVRPEIDEEPRLYRIPVLLPFDNWLSVLPHQMAAYRNGKRVYWSEYLDNGARMCFTYPDQVGGAPKRMWGGRQPILRPLNDGRCEPGQCPDYQKGDCSLRGRLVFYIWGIGGAALIEMPTTSFYGLTGMRSAMLTIAYINGGVISGTFRGKPRFYLTKSLEKVSRVENGKQTLVEQWLPVLEPEADMTEVFARRERAAELADEAVMALEGPEPTQAEVQAADSMPYVTEELSPDDWEPPAEEQQESKRTPPQTAQADKPIEGELQLSPPDAPPAKQKAKRPKTKGAAAMMNAIHGKAPSEEQEPTQAAPDLEQAEALFLKALKAINIDLATYGLYGVKRWGEGWTDIAANLTEAAAEISQAIDAGQAGVYKQRVEEEGPGE